MKVKTSTAQDRRKGYWGGMLFGFVFFSVGAAFLLLSVIPNLWDAYRMQDWVHAQADVEAVDLKRNRSSDGTTYKVTARYRYRYNGQYYYSERVGIADGSSDSIGNWHSDAFARLKGRSQIYIWVNSANPSEAVVDRELRWGLLGFKLIFIFVFGGVGVGLMWFVHYKSKTRPPGQHGWQTRPAWKDNNIRSSAKTGVWVAWGFTIFWNAISSPIPFILPAELAKGNHLAAVGLIFPLFGLGMLVWTIRQTLNWRRFGATLLQMDPFPGAIGGDVGGAMELRLAYNPKYRFRVTLTCQHVYTRRSGDNNRTVRDVKWQDEQLAQVQPGMHGTRLQFLFNPPGDLPQSSDADESQYEWTVQITANLSGTDFDRSWEVPVFKDAGPQAARAQIRSRQLDIGAPELPEKVIRIRETGAGLELYYPYLRQPGMAIGTLVTGGGFAGFAWLFTAAGGKDGMSSLFIGLFIVVGVLIGILGLYMAGNSLRVTVGTNRLRVERRVFGLGYVREVDANAISAIEKSIGMQSTQGNQSRAFYRIQVRTRDGNHITAGSGLTGASHVDAIIERMRNALDLPERSSDAETTESRFGGASAASGTAETIESQQHVKRIRLLVNAVSGVFFFAFVFWNFRDAIFKLF